MLALLYLETNFILSYATGRDRGSSALLNEPIGPISLAIPSICFMEAFSVLKKERKEHGKTIESIKVQIRNSQRNVVYPAYPSSLVNHLEASLVEIERIFDIYQWLLFAAVEGLAQTGEVLDSPREVVADSISKMLVEDPTDNLILATILRHAATCPSIVKAFLTENRKDFEGNPGANEALNSAGVKCFGDANHCIGWINSQIKL